MCQKSNTLKHFFVVLNQPFPLQRPLVMVVVRNNQISREIYEQTRTSLMLNPKQIEKLGVKPAPLSSTYMVPIEIPRDWFLH